MPDPTKPPEWMVRDMAARANSLWDSLLSAWQRQREILDAPDGLPLFGGDYRAPPEREREPEPARAPIFPPPFDGSMRRRRYWKRVTER